jgi:hypothetical protein
MIIQLAKAVKTVSLSYRLLSSSVLLGTLVVSFVKHKKKPIPPQKSE